MAKFYGSIGYAQLVETSPGVWTNKITERAYFGDIIKNTYKQQESENLNSDINIDNKISIVADPFAFENFHAIHYVVWMNAKWVVKSIDVNYPRLVIYIGGVYNEQTSSITSDTP